MYLLVLFVPLLSAIVSGLFGSNVGGSGAGILASVCIVASAMVSCGIFYETVLNMSTSYIELWSWLDSELLVTKIGLQFDGLTAVMLIVVTGVSSLVHIYSTGYMGEDPHVPRFMSYLSLFTFLMIVLVTSDNYVQLFVGWEGVGLCSYLLINFWLTSMRANKAAINAILVNSVGDLGIVLGMLMILSEFGSLEFTTIWGCLTVWEGGGGNVVIICLLLFIGVVGKSAQLGLHTWLPDAMEGPTPVSALIHAATMVTAGVFLIISSGPLFEVSPLVLTIVTLWGATTALFAGIVGVVQNDLKSVIAYSTCSQLGYMVMICGVSNYSVGLFHLLNHGVFKALLFLSAGAVIHGVVNEEGDIRVMGGLVSTEPFVYMMVLIGSMSLMGVPYLTGFYSKDLILELMYEKYYTVFAYWLGSFSVLLTALYSVKLIYLVFLGPSNSKNELVVGSGGGNLNMLLPLCLLGAGSIVVGYLMNEAVLCNVVLPKIPEGIKIVPLMLSVLGGTLGFMVYSGWGVIVWSSYCGGGADMVYTFLNSGWQFNHVINSFIVSSVWKFGHVVLYRVIDSGVLESVGPSGVANVVSSLTQSISILQSGVVYNYVLIMVVFVILFIVSFSV